jgi:Spy/CpxP family protein refolding chaperone
MSRTFRTQSSLISTILAVSAVSFGLLAAACGSTPDTTAAAATADKAAQATVAPQAQAVAMHPGAGVPFLRAVDTLTDLRPDQTQAINGIRASLQQQAAPVMAARAKLGAEIASEVRAGKIDETRIQPLVDQVSAAHTANLPAIQQAMNTLHDTLDATQRQALVDGMHAKAAGWHGKGQMKERMEKMADELGLTDAQRDSIKATLHAERAAHEAQAGAEHPDRAAGKEHMQALAAAFVADKFDAASLNVGVHQGMATHFSKRMTRFLEAAVPVLTADQRNTLATKIESRTQVVDQAADEE